MVEGLLQLVLSNAEREVGDVNLLPRADRDSLALLLVLHLVGRGEMVGGHD